MCNKEFYVSPSILKMGKGKYCSRLCCFKWHRSENSHWWKGGKIKRICQTCGKDFLVKPYYIKKGWAKYCSKKCMGKAQLGGKRPHVFYLRGNQHPMWKGGKILRNCLYCGKEISIYPSHFKKGEGKFCSYECHNKWRSVNRRGQNSLSYGLHRKPETIEKLRKSHTGKKQSQETILKRIRKGIESPNWLGGKSFEPYGEEFNRKLKSQIRERDNHVCQECNYTEEQLGYKLTCHHIDYDKHNNHPSNLIALCKLCHGKTNYNRNDWQQYYKNKIISERILI